MNQTGKIRVASFFGVWAMGITVFIALISCGDSKDRNAESCVQETYLKRWQFFKDSPSVAPSLDSQLIELVGYEAALKNCPERIDSVFGLLQQRIGILYLLNKDFARSIRFFRESTHTILAHAPEPAFNKSPLVTSYYGLSIAYDSLGRNSDKMKALDSCILFSILFNCPSFQTMSALQTKVETQHDWGDYKGSIATSDMATSIVSRIKDADTFDFNTYFRAWTVNNLLRLKQYKGAYKLASRELELLRERGSNKQYSTTYEQLAECLVGLDSMEGANECFMKGLEYCLKDSNSLGAKQTLNNLAYLVYYGKQKDYPRAIKTYAQSVAYMTDYSSKHPGEIFEWLNLYGNIGYTWFKMGNYDSAFTYYKKAFDQLGAGLNEDHILQLSVGAVDFKRIRTVVGLLIEKGETYAKRYSETMQPADLSSAIRVFKITDQLLDKIREEHTDFQSKIFWRQDNRRLYEQSIELCFRANRVEDAYYFIEKCRAVLLQDQINELKSLREDKIIQAAQLKRNILAKEKEQAATSDAKKNQQLKEDIYRFNQELNKLGEPVNSEVSIPALSSVQDALKNNKQSMAEVFVGDSAVYLFFMTASTARMLRIDRNEYEKASQEFLGMVTSGDVLNSRFEDFLTSSHKLYKLLFQDLPLPEGRMVISPDGKLFPFDALVKKFENKKPHFLISEHAISYTYSARYMLYPFRETSKSHVGFLGMAPVQFASAFGLPALQGSAESLQKIGEYFDKPETYISDKASRRTFINKFANYEVVQLYTHASDSSNDGEPMIWFADSVLLLSDLIVEKRPVTRLVVLSACKTGLGPVYKGEGVFSFNRGFAALGIPSAVVNLWSVDSKSTYEITQLLYKYLKEGLPTDIALQKAKLEFMSQGNTLPYYWAAPVLTGKTEVIVSKSNINWKWYVLAIAIGGALGLARWLRPPKQKLTKA